MALLSRLPSSSVLPGGRRAKRFALRCTCLLALAHAAVATATPLPAIAGRDVTTGKRVALSDYRAKPVVVNVWGSWCVPCNREARRLTSFARTHARQVAVLGIDVSDSRAGVRAWYRRYGRAYPSIWDPRALLAGRWARGTPTTLVFDRRHRLVKTIEGEVTTAQLAAVYRLVTRR